MGRRAGFRHWQTEHKRAGLRHTAAERDTERAAGARARATGEHKSGWRALTQRSDLEAPNRETSVSCRAACATRIATDRR